MKPFIPYSLLAAFAACGLASAQTATTGAVGYETLELDTGFNFVGVRLHEAPIAVGQLESATANSVTDDDVDLGALITSGSYILEIEDGSGIIQEITAAGAGTSITTAADLTGLTFPVSYTLRPASTLASVFGSTAAGHKLDIGQGTVAGADQVWFFNGSGYTKLYFDEFGGLDEIAGWYNVDTGAPVSAETSLIYADGFVVSSSAGKDVVVSGDLKAGPTELNLVSGFNFASSVGPVGVTLDTAFGDSAAEVSASGLDIGQGTVAGADQIWIFNGVGYTKIYFDEFGGLDELEGWYNVETGVPVASTTELPAGYVLSAASAKNVTSNVPTYYSGL